MLQRAYRVTARYQMETDASTFSGQRQGYSQVLFTYGPQGIDYLYLTLLLFIRLYLTAFRHGLRCGHEEEHRERGIRL